MVVVELLTHTTPLQRLSLSQTLFYVRGTVITSIWPQILLGIVLVRYCT